jgi:eukaryotic-like serine/threonine-protein kinase
MSVREVKIFVSSPGDVNSERALALRVIKRLQREYVEHLKIVPVLWEQLPLEAVAGFQDEIERIASPSEAEIVIFILWSRLGTPLGPEFLKADGTHYNSGTEYEFDVSLKAREETGKPAILVYIKEADLEAGHFKRDQVDRHTAWIDQIRKVQEFIEHRFFDPQEQRFIRAYHTFSQPPSFESTLEEHLRQILQPYLPEGAGGWRVWEEAPFRGLQVFDFDHEEIFFGRSKAVAEVVKALKEQSRGGRAFVLVLGKSGSGKSSLARAGVAPFICRYGAVEGVNLWRRAALRPTEQGEDLLVGLAAALLQEAALPEMGSGPARVAELAQVFRESPTAGLVLIKEALARAAPEGEARLLLIVDQLEEIFAPSLTREAREAYLRVLAALAKSGVAWLLVTMRSDYYAQAAELAELMALKAGSGQYDLQPPTAADLEQMIRRPAALAGVHFESRPDTGDCLDQALLNEAAAGPESLPLLEYTLDELYQRRTPQGVMTFEAYEELGGMAGALAGRAEAEFQSLGPAEQTAGQEEVFPALVSLDPGEGGAPARKYAVREAVTATPPRQAFVEKFVAARLLIAAHREDGGAVVSWAHDALLWRWERLQKWIERNRELLRARGRLAAAAARWQAEPLKKADLLLPEGKQLAEAREVLQTPGLDLTPAEQAFVRASMARARRGALIRWGAVALLALLTLLAGYQWHRAVLAQKDAERSARAADKARNLAIQALNQVIFAIHDKLAKVPGTHKLRQKLLEDAARDLIRLSEQIQSADRRGDRSLAVAYLKIGDTLLLLGQTVPAQEMYRKCLDIMQALHQAKPYNALTRRDLSLSYDKLGNVSMQLGDLKAAREYFEKALKLKDLLARLARRDQDSAKARRDLWVSYNKLGNVTMLEGDLKAAREYFKKGLELAEQQAHQDPDNSLARNDLSGSYSYLGNVSMRAGNLTAARAYFEKALHLREQLARQDPDSAQARWNLSVSYEYLGMVSIQLGNLKAAREYFEKTLQLREQLALQDTDSAQARRALSTTYSWLGNVSMRLGDLTAARAYFDKGLKLAEQLARQDPDNTQTRRGLLVAFNKLGDANMRLGDLAAARAFFDKGLKLAEQLAHQDPDNAQARSDLAFCYNWLGDVTMQKGDLHAAREYFEKAVQLRERLAQQDPDNAQARSDLAVSYTNLGDVSLQLGDLKGARAYLEKSLFLREQLARQAPNNAQARGDLSLSYEKLGDVSMQAGELKTARESFEKALQLREQLARQDPDNAQAALDLGVSFCKLGQVQRAAKQYPEAEDGFRKALDQLRRLEAQGKLPPAKKAWLATVEKELNALPH